MIPIDLPWIPVRGVPGQPSTSPGLGTPGRNLQGPERIARSEALLSAVIALCRAGCGRTLSFLWIAGSSNFRM
jgi:hypothetical protein